MTDGSGVRSEAVRYRVIDQDSTSYGAEGVALDKARVQAEFGNQFGRSDSWYEYWDVLLAIRGMDTCGVGFKWNEVELI